MPPRLLLFCALISLAAYGAEPPSDPKRGQIGTAELKALSLEELSGIEVTTPSKEPVKAFRTPSAIFVITGDDIRRSGATSIPEALRLAPGVEVARIDGSKWSIGIRGFGSRLTRSVLVLIDGRTVFTPLFAGTYWEVQDTLMEDVDRIEVIRGPGGTIWGPNAVNGVINVITKDAAATQGTLVTTGGGSEEQGFLGTRYGGGTKNLHYRVYAKAFTRGPQFHQDRKNFDDWRSAQSGFRLDWERGPKESVTLQGDLYKMDVGQRVDWSSYTPPYSRSADSNASLSGGNVMARWDRELRPGNSIQLQTYYDRTTRYESNFGEERDTFDVDFLQRLKVPGRQQIAWGVGGRAGPVENIETVSGLTFAPAKRNDYLATAFLQDEIGLLENRLTLILGNKFLKTNFTRGTALEPSIRLLFTPNSQETFWTAFTHALRTPSDAERNFFLSGYIGDAGGTPFFARFNANQNFAPEQLNGYEAGYRRLLRKSIYVDLTGFYNRYHDLFSQDITGAAFVEKSPAPTHLLLPAQFGNDLRAVTKGGEVAAEWRPREFWRLRGSYSYLHMNVDRAPNTRDIGTSAGIMGASPQHQVAIQSAFDLHHGLQFDLNYRFVSALAAQRVPAYSTGDVRFGWQIHPNLDLSIAGRNLMQPSHPEFAGDPGPLVGNKRSAYVKLTWRM